MSQRATNIVFAVISAIISVCFAPDISSATVYRIYEKFEGLPINTRQTGWEGDNFNETITSDITATPAKYTLSAPDIVSAPDGKTYTCVGWKDATGMSPASGSVNSESFTLNSDASITWIYKAAHKLTITAVRSVDTDNVLMGGGRNHVGQVGNGTLADTFSLSSIEYGKTNDFTVISVGTWAHAAALRADGSLYTWGWNNFGQLGLSLVNTYSNVATRITGTLFTDVSAGSQHTAAISTDGSLWSWGMGTEGQLGDGTAITRYTPQQAGKDLDWRSVSAGQDFTLAIKKDGTLWAWGENNNGRLGYPVTGDVNQQNPKLVGSSSDKWRTAVAGYNRSAGIKEDGSLWLWGWNGFGQAGDGTKIDITAPKQIMIGFKWRSVALGYGHTLAVTENGTLWAWGAGVDSRLGLGTDTTDHLTPVQIGSGNNWRTVAAGDKASMAIKTDGTLWGWGAGPFNETTGPTKQIVYASPTQIGTNKDWLQVSIGAFNSRSTPTYVYEAERVMAIRSVNRVEITPFMGTRTLTAGDQFTITAKAVPTNGDTSYFLSESKGSGDVSSSVITANQRPLTLTQNTTVTWTNKLPSYTNPVTLSVSFQSGIPEAVQTSTALYPQRGDIKLQSGKPVTLSAPQSVTLIDGSIWECIGWFGTGDVPLTGTMSTTTFTLTRPSTIIWQYRLRLPDAVTINFSVISGPVTDADADFQMSKKTSTPGAYDFVSTGLTFKQNDQIKLTAITSVIKNGIQYHCTGIKVNTPQYTMPIIATIEGNRTGFAITLADLGTTNALDVTVIYAEATKVAMGQALAVPVGCLGPSSTLFGNVNLAKSANMADSKDNVFFWTAGNLSVYPVRPIPLFTVTCDNNDVKNFYSEWGNIDQGNVLVGPPVNLQPKSSSYISEETHYSESFNYGEWSMGSKTVFQPPKTGRTLLRFSQVSVAAPIFVTVNAVENSAPIPSACTVGTTITPPGDHNDPEGLNGYIINLNAYYDGTGIDKAYDRTTRTGTIIPVNTNITNNPAQDLVVAWYGRGVSDPAKSIGWPLANKLTSYTCQWPTGSTNQIVIAQGTGATLTAAQKTGVIYNQPDKALPGYNPNEEHAFLQGQQLHALRSDLNTTTTSSAYVLLKYQSTPAIDVNNFDEAYYLAKNTDVAAAVKVGTYVISGSDHYFRFGKAEGRPARLKLNTPLVWAMTPYQVLDQNSTYTFTYASEAGSLIQPPSPLVLLPLTLSSRHSDSDSTGNDWYFKDHKGGHWARASNGKTGAVQSKVAMKWYYPLQSGFYYPAEFKDSLGNPVKLGDPIPFLNGGITHTDLPMDVIYTIGWPADAPMLKIGETLTTTKNSLPAVSAMAAVKKIFDEGEHMTPAGPVAQLFAPYMARYADLDLIPAGIKTEVRGGGQISFTDLPYALRSRLLYDPTSKKLVFSGISVDTGTGEPLLLSNIMSLNDKQRIIALLPDDAIWPGVVAALYEKSRILASTPPVGEPQALSAGYARGSGYVVLAENDDPALGSAPVALHTIKVGGDTPYQGEIKVIKSDNPFDEKLTLRHSGDFAGNADNIYFTWYYQPDATGTPPLLPKNGGDMSGWMLYGTGSGKGMNEITIEGAGKQTLDDNWFMVRYYYGVDPAPGPTDPIDPVYPSLVTDLGKILPPGTTDINKIINNWSLLAGAPGGTTAQLAEGWIKRVVSDLNPLDARVADFRNNGTNTTVSMVSQAGQRYNGAIALNASPDNLNNLGLIEAYQTVLNRGESFSINASPPVVDSLPTNNALLNAATRIADFYTLLGNEAYIDSQDPTVGYDTRSGQTGTMASSLFTFQNQVDSLLEEELALLRGRDNIMSTTQASPIYNRLIWNFTNGDGELAYVQTYNISDINIDGFINEADAKIMYPQGHGDAWGHYLTAMTTWYGLLRNPNFTWVPQVESVLVGSSPVPVDYLDERKFARTAAYKAHTGSEIVDLTFRKMYVDDPAGQYLGYKDSVMVTQNGSQVARAWGLDDWGRRAGQGAYSDWVMANAMLPSVDVNPLHTGIQKIDRTTVPELKEITSHFLRMQLKVDQANVGYNPLGLARGVVPFDIDPNLLVSVAGREPQSHFEQIYGRAVKALENARTVYDYATQYAQLLRGNEDTLDTFRKAVIDQEWSYQGQLIGIFGYPYSGDIGTGKTYPAGYDGPDLLHFNYMDVPKLTGMDADKYNSDLVAYKATVSFPFSDTIEHHTIDVSYPIRLDMPWKFDKQADWGDRRAPGEVQMALGELIQANSLYEKTLATYAAALQDIEAAAELLQSVYDIKMTQWAVETASEAQTVAMDAIIINLKRLKEIALSNKEQAEEGAKIVGEGVPHEVGMANDATFAIRAAALIDANIAIGAFNATAQSMEHWATMLEFASKTAERTLKVVATAAETNVETAKLADELARKANNIFSLVPDMYAQTEAVQLALGTYKAALAKGLRLMDELEAYRKRTAGETQGYRYQDMGFRTFRNDAVQKYRATFDLASRYAYLAATAYDYDTNLLRSDKASGSNFLAEISRQLSPGVITNGVPMVGTAGLADPLARLSQNFGVYKTQLGFNNPQIEATPFSLRTGLFRIKSDATSNSNWQEELSKYRVADLNKNESFNRYCRPFTDNTSIAQPGLVIPFSTEVRLGKNFFGWPLGSGDSSYDPSRFATKIRSVGLWFKGYENAGLAETPRAYLVPVGSDVLRSPTGNGFEERHWQVVDQKLPVPFPISTAEITDASFFPVHTTLSDVVGGIRRFSSIRAYMDSGVTGTNAEKLAQMNTDSSLVGRSVWNDQWLLIIPGAYMLDNPAIALDNFINNVSDIRLFFQTYSFSGN